MANDPHDPFNTQLNQLPTLFKQDLLAEYEENRWPRQIEFVAGEVSNGSYPIGLQSQSETRRIHSGYKLDEAAADHYLTGLKELVDSPSIKSQFPDDLNLGGLLVEFSDLKQGLSEAASDVPPGEVLARLTTRELRRQPGEKSQLAHHIQPDVNSAHELVAQLTETPELANQLESALPNPSSRESLTDQLGHIDLTTELWDHQLEALASWIDDGMTGYVNMATATGKTVLGLAAVAYTLSATDVNNPTSLGSLHPADQDSLEEACSGTVEKPPADRPGDVLIVTTDNLLGVQWARLFQEHCQTPPEYTKIEDRTITLPNLNVDIRSAASLTDIDPSEYRIAVFDEVHNYSDDDSWGDPLQSCINSECPVLALTGSVTEQLEQLAADTEAAFPESYTYTHEQALEEGVIPEFEWSLTFTGIQTDTEVAERFDETAGLAESRAECTPSGFEFSAERLVETDPSLTPEQRESIAGEYETPSQVATALRDATDKEGETEISDYVNGDTAPTDTLETLAHGLDTRTLDRMNLRASLQRVEHLAESAIEAGRPTLILTRSYKEAKTLWQDLYDRNSDREVIRFERDNSAEEHADTIAEFDDCDTDQKVLIAPGKYIGQGKDIQSVEVGINLSKQGTGMSTALVQRLGRLLRNAGEKNTVEFYHVIGAPPTDAILPTDGKSFVQTVSEFFGQAIEPDTQGILKPPSVIVDPEVEANLVELEAVGAPTIKQRQVMTDIESAYIESILSATSADAETDPTPVVTTDWFEDVYAEYEYDSADRSPTQSLALFEADSESQSTDAAETEEAEQAENSKEPDSDRDDTDEKHSDDTGETDTPDGVDAETTDENSQDSADDTQNEQLDDGKPSASPDADTDTDTTEQTTPDSTDSMSETQVSSEETAPATETKIVEIDRSVAALIELTIGEDDSEYDTTAELVEAALDPFVKSLIGSDSNPESLECADSDALSVNCGPALEELLTRKLGQTDNYDEASNLILDGLLEAVNLGDIDSQIQVPAYSKYKLSIDTLIDNEDSPVDTPGEAVQIAIENHLDLRDA